MHFMVFLITIGYAELDPAVHVVVAYLTFCTPNLNIKSPPPTAAKTSATSENNRSFPNAFISLQITFTRRKSGNCLETFSAQSYISYLRNKHKTYTHSLLFSFLSLSHGSHFALNKLLKQWKHIRKFSTNSAVRSADTQKQDPHCHLFCD
jgi:hypothetical protein